ncbi:HNH endonuclease [Micropruina sonneratiae]|uniref:HNH endonuclease n=1 Tax=Micropruina sonneratiae TaxID=2986940 RepID=UPI002227195B|nr:HNH endonuclease [Micropruina sp. KQZ13P-5]
MFPGCDNPPETCHAHHIEPWWNGGTTALANLALLCPHHHALIEPSHNPTTHRWTLTLRPDGTSEIRPPRRVDPHQKPRIHARFLTRRRN